jgi:uncharacterized membrane protein
MFEYLLLPVVIVFLLLILAIPIIFIYLFLRLSEAALEQVGFDHWNASLAVFGSVLGSLIDLPLHAGPISSYPGWFASLGETLGMSFPVYFHPVYLKVNVGGCLIPLFISLDLLRRGRAPAFKALLGVLVVGMITYYYAEAVPGEGILLPFWLSPALAAASGLILAKGYEGAPSLAYVTGTLGTLLGADIFSLLTPGALPALSPLWIARRQPLSLSIGGAGIFDGIFLTGVLAVLLAAGIVCLFHGSCRNVRTQRLKDRD